MSDYRKNSRNEEPSLHSPPHSRLFIVCDKQLQEKDFEDAFSEFGEIEDIRLPRDHKTGELKGVAYVKYYKTSHAAAALEEMHSKTLPNTKRPLKVMVAANRSGIQNDYDDEHFKRLFISIPKITTEEDIIDYFQEFGKVNTVTIQRDRNTGESRGFAYVSFRQFSAAALAFEEADKKYRALFAMPKGEKRTKTAFESNINVLATTSSNNVNIMSMMNVQPEGYTKVTAMCSPLLRRQDVIQLFDIVPGMVNCQHMMDLMREFAKVYVTYSNPVSAAYAVQKINNMDYPPGQKIFVKPDFSTGPINSKMANDIPNAVKSLKNAINTATSSTPDLAQLVEAIAQASNLIKTATTGVTDEQVPDSNDLNYCSVSLPPPKPLADINSPIAKRCFLVCQPQPPPLSVLRDIFCRFGDLINVYTIPNKTVGFACYATVEAADLAINTLHGADICGVRTKVLEAEEKRGGCSSDHDHSSKRMRCD